MSLSGALAWIVPGVAGALILAFPVRRRLPAPLVVVLLAASGAAVAWGGLLLQPRPTPVERIVAISVMAVIVPVHVRVVLGRFGPG